jgi:hypothetical protein
VRQVSGPLGRKQDELAHAAWGNALEVQGLTNAMNIEPLLTSEIKQCGSRFKTVSPTLSEIEKTANGIAEARFLLNEAVMLVRILIIQPTQNPATK